MEKLKTPLMINAVYLILVGLIFLSPSFVSSIFGYNPTDRGALLVLSAVFLSFGLFLWGVSADVGKYGGLATYGAYSLGLSTLFLLYGWWVANLFTTRNVLIPVVINVALLVWIWTSKPKS